MCLKHPNKSEIVMIHDSHLSRPSLLLFKKEGHVLVISKSLLCLYRQCEKIGYKINNVDVVHIFRHGIDEDIKNSCCINKTDRLLRKYDRGIK